VESGLVIRKRWLDLILSGQKFWEMRSKDTKKRGPIALIEKGTGLVVGTANLVDSLAPLGRDNYMSHRDKHAIPETMLEEVLAAEWTHPWVLANARRLPSPVPYVHKPGAVTFVRLESHVAAAILRQGMMSAPDEKPLPSATEPPKAVAKASHAAEPRNAAASTPRNPPSPSAAPNTRLFCFRPEFAQAHGHPLPDGRFLVKAGSTAMREGRPKIKRDRAVRDQLVQRGILMPDGDLRLFRFTVDHAFSSASQAAGVVKDGNASGPNLWIDETTGKSLRDPL
jgi:hypothetical protein